MQIQIQVGGAPPQTYAAGQTCNNPRGDNSGALVVMEGGGKWQEAAARGLLWTGFSAAAGVNIPQYSSTVQLFVINNPAGSGYAAVMKGWAGLSVAAAEVVVGGTMLCGLNYSAAGTTAPVVTSSNTIVNNATQAVVGSPIACYSSCTVIAANWWKPSGLTVFSTTAGNTPVGTNAFGEDLDGSVILKPGSWMAIGANVATFGTAILAATWAAVPVGWVN